METPRGDRSSEIIDTGITWFWDATVATGQTCDGGFDNMLTNPTMEFGARPLNLNVYDTVQNSVDFFHHYRKLRVYGIMKDISNVDWWSAGKNNR